MNKTMELEKLLNEQHLGVQNTSQLLEAFGAPFQQAGEILKDYESIVVTDESQVDLIDLARQKRLQLKKTRTEVEHKRKELKADYLKAGKAIDSVARFVKDIIEPAEEYLEKQEKFAEIKAAEAAAKVRADRLEQLAPYAVDVSLYNIDAMDDSQFQDLLVVVKQQHEDRLEQERNLEEVRIAREKAAAEERERIMEENKKLQAERDRLREEAAKRDIAEAKAREAERAAQIESLEASDKDKLIAFSKRVTALKSEIPAVKSPEAQKLTRRIHAYLDKLAETIVKNLEEE